MVFQGCGIGVVRQRFVYCGQKYVPFPGLGKCVPCSHLGILPGSPRALGSDFCNAAWWPCWVLQPPRCAENSSLVLCLFLCGFWKNRFLFPFLCRPEAGVKCVFESACYVSHQSLDGGFTPAQAGSPQCITPLGGFFPMPDQSAYSAGKTSSLLLGV